MIGLTLAVVMALSAAPQSGPKKTQLKIEVKPTSAVFYVDGKRKGTGAKAEVLPVKPGKHAIKVVHNKDMHEEVVSAEKGKTTSWSFAFEDDRRESHPPVEPHSEPAESSEQRKDSHP